MDICIYFQVHQPLRLSQFSIFSDYTQAADGAPKGHGYFDDALNSEIMKKVAGKCYLPTNALMLQLLEKNPEFRISYSLTGVFM